MVEPSSNDRGLRLAGGRDGLIAGREIGLRVSTHSFTVAAVTATSLPSIGGAVRPPRARPLPPDERRAALVAATLPLILKHGTDVSTRQIAEASGVAEGTIFRAFPDKDSLIRATLQAATDPAPLLAELDRVDRTLSLRPRMVAITEILQQRLINVITVMTAVRIQGPPLPDQPRRDVNKVINAKVSALIRADRQQFRCPVTEVARLWRLLLFSGSHPMITDGKLLTPQEIVHLLLDGVLRPDPEGH